MLDDIFEIFSTKNGIDRNKLNGRTGAIPYITRTDMNNGFDSLIASQSGHAINDGNVITIGLDTQTVFYQPLDFYTGQNIQILRNERINRYVAQFLIPCLLKVMDKFNWGGNGATLTRLRRSKILLPVTENNEPDYVYMEATAKRVEAKLFSRYIVSLGYK